MAKKMQDLDRLLSNAKKRKENQKKKNDSIAFDRSYRDRIKQGPLTKEARDSLENNAGVRKARELKEKVPNPIRRKQMERELPWTTMNKGRGPIHSKMNEAQLNSNSREQYNQAVNRITARNTLRGWNNRKKVK